MKENRKRKCKKEHTTIHALITIQTQSKTQSEVKKEPHLLSHLMKYYIKDEAGKVIEHQCQLILIIRVTVQNFNT